MAYKTNTEELIKERNLCLRNSEHEGLSESDREKYKNLAEELTKEIRNTKTKKIEVSTMKKNIKKSVKKVKEVSKSKKRVKKAVKKVPKVEKKLKPIIQLAGSTGWVSFTVKQMQRIGINPNIHTSKELRQKVFEALKLR